jgi:hypothetical protein
MPRLRLRPVFQGDYHADLIVLKEVFTDKICYQQDRCMNSSNAGGLVLDYLEASGHGFDLAGTFFRPIRNNRTGAINKAITAEMVYKPRQFMRDH